MIRYRFGKSYDIGDLVELHRSNQFEIWPDRPESGKLEELSLEKPYIPIQQLARQVGAEHLANLFTLAVRKQLIFVAEENDKPVGYLLFKKSENGKNYEIHTLNVRRDKQSKHIGTGLVDRAVDHFRENGGKIVTTVPDVSVPGFWKKKGFEKSEKHRKYVEMKL